MNKKDLYRSMNEIDDEILQRSETAKKAPWVKWAAIAACLCLVVGGAVLWLGKNPSAPAGGVVTPGGSEAGNYSVAVFPASESFENVASAEVVSLTETEALSHELAKYLPDPLPEGFHFGRGSVYNTQMQDGTRYTMLRIEFMTGTVPEQQYAEDGAAIAPDPNAYGEYFTVSVMNFEPQDSGRICTSPTEITEELFWDGGYACIRLEACYVSIFPEIADPAAVLEAVQNMF